MSPLDINQSDKGTEDRIVVKAFETPGNSIAGGIYDTVNTKNMTYDNWLFSSFYFPVDSCIWDVGCTWTQQVNTNNDNDDTIPPGARSKQPTNAEGHHMIGISLLSPRDKPYDGSTGMTPMTPNQKMKKDPTGATMKWSADGLSGVTPVELALRQRGYLNKAARQLLYCSQASTGQRVSKNIDFTKHGKKGRKNGRKRAFDVPAGSKLVFWTRNMTGADDGTYLIRTSATITPRIRFFPKQNIIQNFRYEDEAGQRWTSNMRKNMLTDEGDGVQELFTTHTASEVKD